jgi:hypothetical protein
MRKIHNNNSGDDEERNPPKGNLENPHKLRSKGKELIHNKKGMTHMLEKMICYWITWI